MKLRVIALCTLAAAGCVADPTTGETDQAATAQQIQHGKDVWFKSTFGGEKFFSVILPAPPFNLPLGLDVVLTSPRDTRFDALRSDQRSRLHAGRRVDGLPRQVHRSRVGRRRRRAQEDRR